MLEKIGQWVVNAILFFLGSLLGLAIVLKIYELITGIK